MKKLTICLFMAAGLLMTASTQAQSKVGYIDVQALIVSMPEFRKADTALAAYQNALNEQYADMVAEFNNKDSILSSKDTVKYTKAQLEVKRRDLGQLYLKLQNWNQQAQQLYQAKEQELLQPVQTKAMKAVSDVAKEAGYGFVLSRQALVVDPPAGDDLLPAVKKKLGIK
ncbi:MAG TPA: OmpH family outer membrane protein [Chitinophagaceae bacterium]